ncbi:MAG TPA: RluA family pseudouridine synthase [Thermoanaerobaculia bacterium]|nr:RluA family pseudouridine synthase [Thermoanaerobaculia bacterium]
MRRTIAVPSPLLEALAAMFPDSSKTTLRKMLQTGRVRVGGEIAKDGKRTLARGEVVEIAQKVATNNLPPSLTILHEDDDVIVVLKAHALLTVASPTEREATAQAYLNAYLKEKGEQRIHVVHRLDRETSGVLVFAKNFTAREALKDRFAEHDVDRVYVAVVEGTLDPPEGTIRSYLREEKSLRMASVAAHPDAKFAVTHYRTLDSGSRYSLVEVTLETGRKNQIRVHFSEAGHPVAGDTFYGARTNPLGRLGLHARLLGFNHPTTGEHMTFTAEIPKAFKKLKLS